MLPFQNCTKAGFGGNHQSTLLQGGAGVDGKTYRSYATCPSGVDVSAALVYQSNVATLIRNNCQDLAVPVTVPPEAIQFASNNSAMLLYDGKIFDQQTASSAQTVTVSFCQTDSVQNAVWTTGTSSALFGDVVLTTGVTSGTLSVEAQANGYISSPNQSSSFSLTVGADVPLTA